MTARSPGRGPLIAVLAAVTALAPLSIDVYTPSLPRIRAELGGPDWAAQASVTGCLLGIAIGQLVWGPLSDRVGRRPVVLAGTIGWTAASFASAVAPSLWSLDAARVLAGLTGSAGIVVARAVVRDVSASPAQTGRRIAVLATVSSLAPIVAPSAGAGIAAALGWRADFALLGAVGVLVVVAVSVAVPETSPPEPVRSEVLLALRRGAADPQLRAIALALGAQSVGFYAYVASASFVVEQQYGWGPGVFALVFGTDAVAVLVANLVFRRLVLRVPAHRLLRAGLAVAALGGLAVAVSAAVSAAPEFVWAAAVVFAAGIGLVLPAAHSAAQVTGIPGGTASALTGAAQFGGGVVGSPITGLLTPSAAALGALLAASSALAIVLVGRARRGPGERV